MSDFERKMSDCDFEEGSCFSQSEHETDVHSYGSDPKFHEEMRQKIEDEISKRTCLRESIQRLQMELENEKQQRELSARKTDALQKEMRQQILTEICKESSSFRSSIKLLENDLQKEKEFHKEKDSIQQTMHERIKREISERLSLQASIQVLEKEFRNQKGEHEISATKTDALEQALNHAKEEQAEMIRVFLAEQKENTRRITKLENALQKALQQMSQSEAIQKKILAGMKICAGVFMFWTCWKIFDQVHALLVGPKGKESA